MPWWQWFLIKFEQRFHNTTLASMLGLLECLVAVGRGHADDRGISAGSAHGMSLITDTPIGAADGRRCASDDEPPIPAGTSLPRVRTV